VDEVIEKMYIKVGGGRGEPYADAAYFYQSAAVSTPNCQDKPFFFFTGRRGEETPFCAAISLPYNESPYFQRE
jgi:hypothetical protein